MECSYTECNCACCKQTSCVFKKMAPAVNLIVRVYIANIFFVLGLEKLQNWDAALFLFQNEYQVPILPYWFAAVTTVAIQLICSAALVLGYHTKFAALVLFIMVALSTFFYQQFVENYYWMMLLALFASYGADRLSLDYFLAKKKNNNSKKKQ
jgi:putative oxidoreductase